MCIFFPLHKVELLSNYNTQSKEESVFIFAEWSHQLHSMGLVHIIGIVSAVLFGIGGGFLAKKTKTPEKVYAVTGITLIVLELLKLFFMISTTGTYPLEKIPFQICTVELFFLWAVPLVKNEKVKNGMIAYTVIGLMAASFYYVKPSTILNSSYIFLSLQAMVWHNIVIMIGVFSIVYYNIYGKKGKRYIIDGYILWLVLTFVAIIVDVICAKTIPEANINFFYLSPIQDSVTYPMLNLLFKKPSPYPIYLISFIIYYSLGVAALYGLLTGIDVIKEKHKAK